MSTLTLTPSTDRTAATGTSNASSRVVTRWVRARNGLTRWTPASSTAWWRFARAARPTRAGRDPDEQARRQADEDGDDRDHDDRSPAAAAASGRNSPDAASPMATRIQIGLIGAWRWIADDDRDPALGVGDLDGVRRPRSVRRSPRRSGRRPDRSAAGIRPLASLRRVVGHVAALLSVTGAIGRGAGDAVAARRD